MTRQELSQILQRKLQEREQYWQSRQYERGMQVIEELRDVPGMMEVDEFQTDMIRLEL